MAVRTTKTRVETRSAVNGKIIESASETKTISRSSSFSAGRLVFSIFCIVLFLLVLVNFVRTGNNSSSVSFSGFLEYISHAPNLRINFNINTFQIAGEWVILDGLRKFINTLGAVIGAAVYAAVSVINTITYFGYYILYLFA